MEKWRGKVAVVTGASAGIGAQIAQTLSDKGMIVVGLSRRSVIMKIFNAEHNGKIHSIKCDITKEEDILAAFRYIEQSLGGVDLMINNAGVAILTGLIDGKTESWKETFDINVMALNICNREALKSMRQRGDNGQIININSIYGHTVPKMSNCGVYSASKHAVTALTESLRNDLKNEKSRIKVTSLSPGYVLTDMSKNNAEKLKMQLPTDGALPPGFLGPKDVAAAVVSILSFSPNVEINEMVIQSN